MLVGNPLSLRLGIPLRSRIPSRGKRIVAGLRLANLLRKSIKRHAGTPRALCDFRKLLGDSVETNGGVFGGDFVEPLIVEVSKVSSPGAQISPMSVECRLSPRAARDQGFEIDQKGACNFTKD